MDDSLYTQCPNCGKWRPDENYILEARHYYIDVNVDSIGLLFKCPCGANWAAFKIIEDQEYYYGYYQ